MSPNEVLTASQEDYLEAIFHIIGKKQAARAKDISKRLKVSGASVTGALRSLSELGMVNYAPYDVITLTAKGRQAAREVVRRHEVLRDFFVNVLAIDEAKAEEAACRMEHSVPRAVVERLIGFAEFVEVCPRGGAKWVAGFGYHCDPVAAPHKCERCISITLGEVRERMEQGQLKTDTKGSLGDLKPGQKARVSAVRTGGETGRRIAEMGIITGAFVEVERVAPLGDPVDVKVKGYHLSLRKEEAGGIDVETVD